MRPLAVAGALALLVSLCGCSDPGADKGPSAQVQEELAALKDRLASLEEQNAKVLKASAEREAQLEQARAEREALAAKIQTGAVPEGGYVDARTFQLLINSPDPDLVRTAFLLARKIPSPERTQAVIAQAKAIERPQAIREAAVETLSLLNEDAAREALVGFLGDREGYVVAKTAQVLAKTGDNRFTPALAEAMGKLAVVESATLADPARQALLDALGVLGDRRATALIAANLKSPHGKTQELALRALRNIGDPAATPALLEFLKNLPVPTAALDTRVHREVVDVLGLLGDPGCGAALADLLNSPNVYLRDRAALQLPRVATPALLPALAAAFKMEWAAAQAGKKSGTLLEYIIRSMGATRDPKAAEVLLQALAEGMKDNPAREATVLLPQLCAPKMLDLMLDAHAKSPDAAAKATLEKILRNGTYPVKFDEKAKTFAKLEGNAQPEKPGEIDPVPQKVAEPAKEQF